MLQNKYTVKQHIEENEIDFSLENHEKVHIIIYFSCIPAASVLKCNLVALNMPGSIKEQGERVVSPQRFPKESLAGQLLARKEGTADAGAQENGEIKKFEERFNKIARIAIARTADPLNPQAEEPFKEIVDGKVVGEIPHPAQSGDIASPHAAEIVTVQQELTKMFQETLQKQADKLDPFREAP